MPLNPAYVQQSTRPLPFCVGYVYAQGDKISSIVGADGATVELYILAEGEWESCLYLSVNPGDLFIAQDGVIVGGVSLYRPNKFVSATSLQRATYYHFHTGAYATKGMPNNLISVGPENSTENWLRYFPAVTPALNYSGMVYYMVRRVIGTGTYPSYPTAMNPIGIYRSLKCRVFDGNGDVTAYGFTINPTWQMIETLLRYQIKCQQPGLAGLLASERACFDWPSLVDHAARNAALLANGSPRYAGNFAFAADATVASMMETQLRNCRSYKRERGGKISFAPDDNRASVFTFSQRHIVPGTLQLSKKDLSAAANVYEPQYRDLGIPAAAQIASVTTVQTTSGVTAGAYLCTFNTVGQQPFFSKDVFTYSGGSDDADFAGDYQVQNYTTTISGVITSVAPPNATNFNTDYGPQKAATATGGYVGTNQSRFSQRAPSVVQHRSHQRSLGQVAPGITPLARAIPVQYDLGNNTFDQTNRIMKWMRDRDLGTDGAGWIAPFEGSVTAYLEGVDDFNGAIPEIEDGDVITLDETAAPDFPGARFEVLEHTVTPPAQGSTGQVEFVLKAFCSNPNPDVSDPPGDSYQTLPNSLLPMRDTFSLDPEFWLTEVAITGGTDSGGMLSLNVNASIWWVGDTAPTVYEGITISSVPLNHLLTLYLVVVRGATPTLSLDTTNALPPEPIPPGKVILYFGTIASLTAVTSGSGTVHGDSSGGAGDGSGNSISTDNSDQPIANGTGPANVTFTPFDGLLGGDPVSSDVSN